MFDHCGRYCLFYGVADQSVVPLLLLVDHFGTIRDTINSTTVATGIEKMTRISELDRVSVDPHVKSMNSPFKVVLRIHFWPKTGSGALYVKRREIFKAS